MSSLKQIEANRRNALKSTGPTSSEGKRRSRRNALRHGLTAETIIAALEDAEDYEAFEAAVISDYEAESAVERELVLRLASVLWRLRRATGIETALFDVMTENSFGQKEKLLSGITALSLSNQNFSETAADLGVLPIREKGADMLSAIANSFLRLVALPTCPLDRLSRYEYLLWRQAHQIIFTLETTRYRGQPPRRSRFASLFGSRNGVSGIVR